MILNGMAPVDRIGPLNLRQTKALANIVAIRMGIWGAPALPQAIPPRGGLGPQGGTGAGALPGQYYRPPFKHNQTIPVNIPFTGDGYEVRKR